MLKTFKDAFKHCARVTIFVINRYLQAYIFKDNEKAKRFYKSLNIGREIVYGVFNDEKEFCTPHFTSVKDAKTVINNTKTISVPCFNEDVLIFTIQVEVDERDGGAGHQVSGTKGDTTTKNQK